MSSHGSNWKEFLAPRAIVMARRRSIQEPVQEPGISMPVEPRALVEPEASLEPGALIETPQIAEPGAARQEPQATVGQGTRGSLSSLEQIAQALDDCRRCKLCQKRKTVVVGEGNPHAELVFVGEGPGEQEDLEGRPFVGKAGQLLDKMIQAIGLQRQNVYIANVVKCRPPGNRNPEPDEIEVCSPFLIRQLELIRPRVIVALGKFAAQTLLQSEVRITQVRGKFQMYRTPRVSSISEGIKLMPTFHPSYLLRNPAAKKESWADLQLVAKELGLEIPRRG